MSVREVIEQHRTSPYFIPRFGGGLPARPMPTVPPDEIQGGEPLLNFPLIEYIVSAAKKQAAAVGKSVDFVIATNLALLDDAVLAFCKSNSVLLSTSLDGPADLHNKNRPRPGGNSHELATGDSSRSRSSGSEADRGVDDHDGG